MKKIIAIIATMALAAGTAFAGSVTVEGAKINTIGGNDQMNSNFTLSESINDTFGVHTQLSSTQTDNTNSVSTRLEVGGTATTTLFGPVKGYAKVAVGQKFSTAGSGQFTYYSIEPGVSVPLSSNLTAKVAYRYRTAAENANVNKDTTDTVRVGLTYAISKKDAVGFRFDRITGDSRQDGYNVFYTRSF
jgi:opacity protein-like surface antigen